MKSRHFRYLFCILCIAFLLTGCSYFPSFLEGEEEDTWADSGSVAVGKCLTIQNTANRLDLQKNIDTLSADGLYYAAWTIGDSESYENGDGETVDLYDAQLYLLLGEFPTDGEAQEAMDKWLAAGKTNYEVLSEEEIVCNGQPYILITYNCVSENNPYDRGVSAFGVYGENAVCIELTCKEEFGEDEKEILVEFLEGCAYGE